MTALSGQRLGSEPSPPTSVLERPDAVVCDQAVGARPLDGIFPLRDDATRGRQMEQTWRAFGAEMDGAVRASLDGGRSPPEIAYAIGEIVHNYFRTRGATLTSFELRRLVAELLAVRQRSPAGPEAALVAFTTGRAAPETPWTGDEADRPAPVVSDAAFAGPPSPLIGGTPCDSEAALLAEVTARARARLSRAAEGSATRQAAIDAIDAALDELFEGRPAGRARLARLGLSELCGLGPLDLIWADRSVDAVFVNGPAAVYVERHGTLAPSPHRFRDQAHLQELVGRLVPHRSSAAATFRLRDGSEGLVVFPPAAPAGPALALRRGDPGQATFERLIAAALLDRRMADLLRIAARCRLNVVVVGPSGSGKTALLAAVARDLSRMRVVTLARHRSFGGPSPSQIELVVPADDAFATLLAAAAGLRPHLLIVDPVRPVDAPVLSEFVSRPARGVVAALELQAMAGLSGRAVDLYVRLGRLREGMFGVVAIEDSSGAPIFVHEDGRFARRTTAPSFAGDVRKAGYGEALANVLRA